MALLNHAKKELSAKIVYYGPGLSGKTTNLEWIHRKLAPDKRGKLISLETKTDRTLFFDFLPVHIGEISGFRTRFNIYTVPGQIFYNETRRMVLKGVDGIVFVADSQKEMATENLENLKNLTENLRSIGKELQETPLILQFNKRDLPNILSVEEMNRLLNTSGLPFFEAVAVTGEGVLTTLTRVTRVVADHLKQTLFASPKPQPSVAQLDSIPAPEIRRQASDSFGDSGSPLLESDAPAFLEERSEIDRPTNTSEPQVISEHSCVTASRKTTFQKHEAPVNDGPILASVDAPAAQALQADKMPSLGDADEPFEPKPVKDSVYSLVSGVEQPHLEPAHKPEPEDASSMARWMDPSVVTVSAEKVSSPESQKGVAFRFGDPERETGNQVRIPVALRLEESNEIISFQMVIRVEPQSDS